MIGKINQEPLFSCVDCYEHRSFPAAELRLHDENCYCIECWEYSDLSAEIDYSDLPRFEWKANP